MKKKAKAKAKTKLGICSVSHRFFAPPFPFNEPPPLPKTVTPAFGLGTVIQGASLVTDRNGVAWWVDPAVRLIRKAEPQ